MKNNLGDFKIYGVGKVGPKSQIVIPKEVRKALNINPGDDLVIITKNDKGIVLIKADNLNEFLNYVNDHLDS